MDPEFDIEIDEPLTASDSALVVMAFDRSNRVIDVDGHMHVETSNISKANVCPYLGSEIPNAAAIGLDPAKIYYLYRDAAELEAAAPTFENKPLMVKHVVVSADTPQKFMIAGVVSNVRWRPPYLIASLAVWDAEAIRAIDNQSQRELSSGYRYDADMTPGTIDGVKYDGIMRNIVGNHVALVTTGRVGPDVLVSDHLPTEFATMKKSALLAAIAPFLAADVDQVALDAAIVTLAVDKKAKDAECKDPEDGDQPKAQDKGAKGKDESATEEAAEDEDMEDMSEDEAPEAPEGGAPKPAKTNIKAGADKAKGMDEAVSAAVNAALAQRDALHVARREVESVIGVVAYDSAAEVYKAALVKLGVACDGVDPSAFPALLKLAKDKAAPAPTVAADHATVQSMSKAFGLDRFSK